MTTSTSANTPEGLKKFAALFVIAAMVIAATDSNVSSRDTETENAAPSPKFRNRASVLKTKVIWELTKMLAATADDCLCMW